MIGSDNLSKLRSSKVAVVGLGGVGGACAEALCRAGIGSLVLCDNDVFDITNLNRQLFATEQTIGKSKCKTAEERLLIINPNADITVVEAFYSAENRELLFDTKPDYIVDAIDTVSSKLDLIETAFKKDIPIVSCMGTGNRLDPTKFKLGDISETAGCGCGLARVMRRELKKRGVAGLMTVYSTETPKKSLIKDDSSSRHSPGSISFCPPVAGYILTSHVIKSLTD